MGQIFMRKCHPDPGDPPPPPPPPPIPPQTPCEVQKLAQLKAKKAKLKKCVPICKPPPPPPKAKPCEDQGCLCIERVKHPFYPNPCELNQQIKCVVERVLPGRPRCVYFNEKGIDHNPVGVPCRRDPPPASAPPRPLTTCEQQKKIREAYLARYRKNREW
ncbi:WAS/WASL-interacting protein family member 3-like [Helicoverpa zea]|uniref:WAS/WASL-interacting protein family member 3-like n=1 Tax=Helicoverpa zea TaxID=7113 RepID=UPI001F57CF9F|nr:WAS/WASL-interacting protein family member 3-like [Helicoverpa zea]